MVNSDRAIGIKPLALCAYLIQLAVPEVAVVLGGSGTTAIAARI